MRCKKVNVDSDDLPKTHSIVGIPCHKHHATDNVDNSDFQVSPAHIYVQIFRIAQKYRHQRCPWAYQATSGTKPIPHDGLQQYAILQFHKVAVQLGIQMKDRLLSS